MNKKLFIVLEGIDYAGKSSTGRSLEESFGFSNAIYTHEPTDSFIGSHIRDILRKNVSHPDEKTMQVLFAADRYIHLRLMDVWLLSGFHVICDRYVYSSLAYNCRSIEEQILTMGMHTYYFAPDIIFWLDLPVEEAMRRAKISGRSLEVYENNYLEEVRDRYKKIFEVPEYLENAFVTKDNNRSLVYKIDAMQSQEQVVDNMLNIIKIERDFPYV